MSTNRVLGYWYAGGAIATAVVVAVAALLIAIIATARSIRANALRIIDVADGIVANTMPVWKLQDTTAVSAHLLNGARSIARHASEAADILDGQRAH